VIEVEISLKKYLTLGMNYTVKIFDDMADEYCLFFFGNIVINCF